MIVVVNRVAVPGMIMLVRSVVAGVIVTMGVGIFGVRVFVFVFMAVLMAVGVSMLVAVSLIPVRVLVNMGMLVFVAMLMAVFVGTLHFWCSFPDA